MLVGRWGNAGGVYWGARDFWRIDTVYFVVAQTSDLYLDCALQENFFIGIDVAMRGLNRNLAYCHALLLPPPKLRIRFLETAGLVPQRIDTLAVMNEKLRSARNLLPPRLMSAELTV